MQAGHWYILNVPHTEHLRAAFRLVRHSHIGIQLNRERRRGEYLILKRYAFTWRIVYKTFHQSLEATRKSFKSLCAGFKCCIGRCYIRGCITTLLHHHHHLLVYYYEEFQRTFFFICWWKFNGLIEAPNFLRIWCYIEHLVFYRPYLTNCLKTKTTPRLQNWEI